MSNVTPQRSKEDDLLQQHPTSIDFSNFVNVPLPPDLTLFIIKTDYQYVAGGAFGDVYKCRYVNGSTSEDVAVKALRFTLNKDSKNKSMKMVRREFGVWRRLGHSNIVPFLGIAYGFGMDGAMSLVSLWMPNDTLHKFLKMHDDKLDAVHRLQILCDVARGLGYLHSLQIVHGDLNSNNVLLDADYTARLADFGYASLVGNIPDALGYLQRSTDRPGALRWAVPEQINLEGPFIRTTKSDIYSFGCIALEVLSGKQPWSEVREDAAVVLHLHLGHKPGRPESRTIDDSYWNFIHRCWSPLQERPSADTIVLSIQQFLNEYPPFRSLRDLLISLSSQAQDLPSGTSLSLTILQPPSLLETTTPSSTPPSPPPAQDRLSHATDLAVSTTNSSAQCAPHKIQNGATGGPEAMPAVGSLNRNVVAALSPDTQSPLISTPPPPDLTSYIIKTERQYVAGGGFSDVYRCRYLHGSISHDVAVKALRFKFTLDGDKKDKSIEMVRRELGIWKRLRHNNVVPFLGIAYGFGMDGTMSLVSLWMPNGTLHKFLTTHDDKLDVVHRLRILLDIANGLDHLHSFSIVHGGLNSYNVLLDADYTARLADFGYASLVGDTPEALAYLQRSTDRPGTLRWVVPEQIDFEGTLNRTPKTDIHSFGCIALEGSLLVTCAKPILIFLQVLSGKQSWSEVLQDAAVVLRLHQGHKPGEPESRTIDDSHWHLIQRCWSSLRERPSADMIILSIQQFLSSYPPSGPLRDSFISPSSQDSLCGASLSPAAARPPSVLATAIPPLTPPNPPSLATPSYPLPSYNVASSIHLLPGSSIPDDSAARGMTSSADYRSPINENDIVIAVMGRTGAGKSSFVNSAAGRSEVLVGHDLKSQTRAVQPVRCSRPDGRRNVVLLDTPGFDDTYLSDAEILRIVANWLKETYQNNIKLAGILYFHPISDIRMAGTPLRNLAVFKDLCGEENLKSIILVTTMWDEIEDQSIGLRREEELRTKYWKDMIRFGSDTCRFQGNRESAWEIIDHLNLEGSRQTRTPLRIQREMVDSHLPLHETAAAKTLRRFLAGSVSSYSALLRGALLNRRS